MLTQSYTQMNMEMNYKNVDTNHKNIYTTKIYTQQKYIHKIFVYVYICRTNKINPHVHAEKKRYVHNRCVHAYTKKYVRISLQ